METQIIDLILLFAALGIAFFVLYQLINFIQSRPDIVALLSVFAIAFGFVGMVTSDKPMHGLVLCSSGCIFLCIAAFNYNRSKGVKS